MNGAGFWLLKIKRTILVKIHKKSAISKEMAWFLRAFV